MRGLGPTTLEPAKPHYTIALMLLNAVRVFSLCLICTFVTLTPASSAPAVTTHPGNHNPSPGTPVIPGSPSDHAGARDIFKQLIEIDTSDTPQGSVTAATEAMQSRFLNAGFTPED